MPPSEHKLEANKAKTKRAFVLLRTAVEVRNGLIREEGTLPNEELDVRLVSFSMLQNGMLSRAAILNGDLFVSVLDAATMDARDRQRMLVVARAVADA